MDELDERQQRILDFERRSWRSSGVKDEAIRDELGLSAVRYYQLLARLIDSPAALRHDPMLVRRLQRMRDTRREARERRTLRPAGPQGRPFPTP